MTVEAPITRIETPAGDEAWWVTGHPEAKFLLADRRIGMSHPHPETAGWYARDDVSGRPRGDSKSEYSEHALWRTAMTRVFSPRFFDGEIPYIEKKVHQLIDDMLALGGPLDLISHFTVPLCSDIMCRLLGVPAEDVSRFRDWTEEGARTGDPQRSLGGIQRLMSYVASIVGQRRREPRDDHITELIRAAESGDERPQAGRVEKLLAGMLAFGRETPASAIDRAVLQLVTHPDQLGMLRNGAAPVDGAVEESLRMFRPPAATPHGLLRYANADVEFDDVRIARGDMTLIDIAVANFDDRVFADPMNFDILRRPNPHLTFGHGFYMCNFAKLARSQLRISIDGLTQRLPELRLAVPVEELRFKSHLRTGGLEQLPVTW
ncbi:MAG TPA: cytochrome P450 [Jatrophihabitans sp.]|nr:cytochrome P450 [Jatrophihabitans sp.]